MSDENKHQAPENTAAEDNAAEKDAAGSGQRGPKFTKPPGNPLAGIQKGASDVLASMEGKTVSLKVYVGTIAGIVLLMLLARCGG